MWQTTDRSTLQIQTVSNSSFIDIFLSLLHKLKTHSFIFKQQSSYFKILKGSLCKGEFLIFPDFSENYAFIVHRESDFKIEHKGMVVFF